jgi:DNA-binding response OmpR family regulator
MSGVHDVQGFSRVRVPTSRRDAIIRADGMRTGTVVQCFGPFELDPASGRLFRGRRRVPLSETQAAILVQLVSNVGEVVSREALIEAAWGNTAVTENSLDERVARAGSL